MKVKWKLCASIAIASILCAGYTWGIPALVNLPKNKVKIEEKIFSQTGYKIDIGNPKMTMGVFPSVWVESNNISVINSDNTKALSIENPRLKLKLLPLLKKQIQISHISSSSEIVNLVLTSDKEFLLGEYPLKFDNKEKKFTLQKIDMNLGAYDIVLDDKLNNKKVVLAGKYLNNGEYIKNKQFKFGTEGIVKIDNVSTPYLLDTEINLPINMFTKNKLKLIANIKDFDLSSISSYVNILSKDYVKDLKGILNFVATTKINSMGQKQIYSNLTTEKLLIKGEDKPTSIDFDDKLSFKINFETTDEGVNFQDTSITAKDINLRVSGKLSESGKKVPAMDLEVEANDSRLERICKIIPGLPDLLPEMDLYKLKKYFFYGNGEGKVRFVGNGERPEVFGQVKLRNVYVIKPIPKSADNASVDLNFKGKIMDINVYVPTSNQNVTLDGFIKIDGSKYSELKIKSTDSVDMQMAQEIVNPLHEIFKFKLGPVPIMKLAGLASLDIRSAGKKIDPHLWGNFKFRNATASFNDINNLEMKNAAGIINFDNTDINFKTTNATINGKSAQVHGDCDVKGNMNVFASTSGQNISDILKVIYTSPEMKDVQRVIKPFTNADGLADIFLNIYGTAKDAEKVKFNKDIFAKGKITLHNATTTLKDTYLPLHNVNGIVNFNKKNGDYDVSGYIRNSKLTVKGTSSETQMDLTALSDKFALSDIFDLLHPNLKMPYKNQIGDINVSFNGKYSGIADSDNLDYDKIVVEGKILPNFGTNNPIKISAGDFNIKHSALHGNNLKGTIHDNPFTISFTGRDIYKNMMKIADAKFNLPGFNLASLNNIKDQLEIPLAIKSKIDNTIDFKGSVDVNGYMKNGSIWADTDLRDTSFIYKPADAAIRILSGKANIRNNTLYLGNINSRLSSMPLFVNGKITNIQQNPYLDLYLTGKPTQMFFDRFINTKSVYPVKVKGDINFNAKLKGTLDKIYANSILNINENSYIYYMGATLQGAPSGATTSDGISTNPISITANAILSPNKIKFNSLKYDQIITSQNKRASIQNQIVANGDIELLKNNVIGFNNFRIKTTEPTNAKIFNVLFKKPTIKQGIFTSDLTINGTSLAPNVLGQLNVSSVDIPLLDATVHDVNLDFQKDYIYLKSKGVILTSDISVIAKIINNPLPPYVIEDLDIDTDTLDLNLIMDRFNDFDTDKLRNKHHSQSNDIAFSPNQVILKKGTVNAEKILIKKAQAQDFMTHMHLADDHILKIDNYSFNIANGLVDGTGSYDLNNLNAKGQMHIKGADAEIISENFFDMPGQMYGIVTGDLEATCKGISGPECVSTLSGEGKFSVKDGRMPKLGSLEYLLKAANLVTGGITGVSINSIIDIITPIKSGNFDDISGEIKVENGVANDINVYSSGKELNMYLTGSYNLSNLVADMEVYGSLSKDFSNVLGFIANLSLQRLFNKIPGISINEINPRSTSNINKIPNFDKANVLRVFKAEIYGDINGSNYVKSFRWIRK